LCYYELYQILIISGITVNSLTTAVPTIHCHQ